MALLIRPGKRLKKAKSKTSQEVLDRLKSYLESTEVTVEPVKVLCGFWKDQQNAITYQELREAVKNGEISSQTIRDWSQDYSVLVSEKLSSMWTNAIEAGPTGQPLMDGLAFEFNTQSTGILNWIKERGAAFVTASTEEQKDAIATLLTQKMRESHTVDELARMIRPCIGLTEGQAAANAKYYDNIVATLTKDHPRMSASSIRQKALDASQKYAERQHRQRALTIAQTESAFAYNRGADEGVRQAQEQNLLGEVKKVWSTSGDDAVCDICAALEGTEVSMDDSFEYRGKLLFPGQKMLPPAHPRCACAVEYIETSKPQNIADTLTQESLLDTGQEETPKQFNTPDEAEEYFGKHPDRTIRRENREEYDRLMVEYQQSSYKSWESSLESSELSAIENYAGPDYNGINGLLRHQMTENQVTMWNNSTTMTVQDMISDITTAIDKFELKDSIKVYRTCEEDVLESLQTKIGSTFHDDGFGSTTVVREKKASGNIFMEIEVPKGKGIGAWISPIAQPDEYEFLLQRGTDYIITGVEQEGADTVVKLKVVGNTKTDWSFASKEEVIAQWKKRGFYNEDSAKLL
jgi:hypothetical protein